MTPGREIVEAFIHERGIYVMRTRYESLIVESDLLLESMVAILTGLDVQMKLDPGLFRRLLHRAADEAVDAIELRDREDREIEETLEGIEFATISREETAS